MAKGTSFADKSKGKKGKGQTYVKYVKSVQSEKTGHWRFNEQVIGLDSGENLDGALKRIEEEKLALDMELPSPVEEVTEEVTQDENTEETAESAAEETSAEVGSEEVVEEEETPSEEVDTAPEVVEEDDVVGKPVLITVKRHEFVTSETKHLPQDQQERRSTFKVKNVTIWKEGTALEPAELEDDVPF